MWLGLYVVLLVVFVGVWSRGAAHARRTPEWYFGDRDSARDQIHSLSDLLHPSGWTDRRLVKLIGPITGGSEPAAEDAAAGPVAELVPERRVAGVVAEGEYRYYRVPTGPSGLGTPAGQGPLRIVLESCTGNADLFVSQAILRPTRTHYTWSTEALRGPDTIVLLAASGGSYAVAVFGQTAAAYHLYATHARDPFVSPGAALGLDLDPSALGLSRSSYRWASGGAALSLTLEDVGVDWVKVRVPIPSALAAVAASATVRVYTRDATPPTMDSRGHFHYTGPPLPFHLMASARTNDHAALESPYEVRAAAVRTAQVPHAGPSQNELAQWRARWDDLVTLDSVCVAETHAVLRATRPLLGWSGPTLHRVAETALITDDLASEHVLDRVYHQLTAYHAALSDGTAEGGRAALLDPSEPDGPAGSSLPGPTVILRGLRPGRHTLVNAVIHFSTHGNHAELLPPGNRVIFPVALEAIPQPTAALPTGGSSWTVSLGAGDGAHYRYAPNPQTGSSWCQFLIVVMVPLSGDPDLFASVGTQPRHDSAHHISATTGTEALLVPCSGSRVIFISVTAPTAPARAALVAHVIPVAPSTSTARPPLQDADQAAYQRNPVVSQHHDAASARPEDVLRDSLAAWLSRSYCGCSRELAQMAATAKLPCAHPKTCP